MDKRRTLSTLAFFACLFALCVIGLGAFTRLIDGGLGCPDWPGCYGHLTAPALSQVMDAHYVTYKAWAEMIHRYFAGGLSILIIAIVTLSFTKQCRSKTNIITSLVLIALIIYQIILGQLTVTLKLLPLIVTGHLLGGFLILSTLWLVHLNNDLPLQTKLQKTNLKLADYKLVFASFIALFILFAQIFLGAWTSTNYASLSCPDFPFCISAQVFTWHFYQAFDLISPLGVNYDGGVLPEAVRQTIQMTHRIGALVFTSYILLFSLFAMPKIKNNFEILKSLYLVFGLLSIQLCLGISNVVFKLPTVTAIFHNLVAALLLIAVISLTYKIAKTAWQQRSTL